MPVIVVANPKGGVGKSTLATNIAGYWATRGHKVFPRLAAPEHVYNQRPEQRPTDPFPASV